MAWAVENVETLKKLYADGLSGTQIAAVLGGGITRNAVIGKIHRLGLVIPTGTVRIDREKVLQGATQRLRRRRGRAELVPRPPREPALERITQELTPSEFLSIPLEALTPDTCRWPRGDGPFTFCGQKPLGGSSYCARCYRRSINLGSVGEEVA